MKNFLGTACLLALLIVQPAFSYTDDELSTMFDKVTKEDSYVILEKDDKKGVAINGEIIIPAEYDEVNFVKDSKSTFFVEKNNKKGLIDNGKIVFPCEYDNITKAYLGWQYIVEKNSKKGVFKILDGSQIIGLEFDDIVWYNYYYLCTLGNKKGLIDTNGSIIIPIQYDDIFVDNNNNSYFITVKDGKKGYAGSNGVIVPAEYSDLQTYYGDYVVTIKGNKQGLIQDKKVILDAEYDQIKIFEGWHIIADKNGQKASLYKDKKIVPLGDFKSIMFNHPYHYALTQDCIFVFNILSGNMVETYKKNTDDIENLIMEDSKLKYRSKEDGEWRFVKNSSFIKSALLFPFTAPTRLTKRTIYYVRYAPIVGNSDNTFIGVGKDEKGQPAAIYRNSVKIKDYYVPLQYMSDN